MIIDTKDGIEHYTMASAIAMLKIEVRTGMKNSRGSVLKAVQGLYGVTSKTKKGALDEMLALYEQKYGRPYGKQS